MVDKAREDAKFRVMHLIQERPEISQRQLAAELGLSLGMVNYCLQGLIEKGHVKIRNLRASPSKLKYAYLLPAIAPAPPRIKGARTACNARKHGLTSPLPWDDVTRYYRVFVHDATALPDPGTRGERFGAVA